MRTLTRLVTTAAVVVGYTAAILAINAGIDLRERNAFHDAPAQLAAFRTALEHRSGAEAEAVSKWFGEHAPAGSDSRASIFLATYDAEEGRFDAALKYVSDVDAEIEDDQKILDEVSAASWGRAIPWLVIGALLIAASVVLQRRKRAANAAVVDLVSQYVPPRPFWRRPVFLVVTGIGYVLLIAGFFAVIASTRPNDIPWAVRGFLIGGGAVTLPVAYYVLRYSRPRSARGAAQALRADGREPVLYLRGFGDDQDSAVVDRLPGTLTQALITVHTREEQLIGSLGAFGPVIAVGRPGEPLPHLGAARFYLPADDWQAGVLELMELSQLIVLRLGSGDGVWWEVDQARATQPPHKLMLLLPGGREDLAARLDEHLPKPANARPEPGRWTASVIVFDQDWTPRVHAVGPFLGEKNQRGTPAFYLARAMQFALHGIGAQRRAMKYRINSQMLAAYGKVMLLLPGLVLVVMFLRLVFLW